MVRDIPLHLPGPYASLLGSRPAGMFLPDSVTGLLSPQGGLCLDWWEAWAGSTVTETLQGSGPAERYTLLFSFNSGALPPSSEASSDATEHMANLFSSPSPACFHLAGQASGPQCGCPDLWPRPIFSPRAVTLPPRMPALCLLTFLLPVSSHLLRFPHL